MRNLLFFILLNIIFLLRYMVDMAVYLGAEKSRAEKELKVKNIININ